MDAAALLAEVTTVGCAGLYADLHTLYPNLPRSLANRLGISADAVCHQRGEGGDGAQALTNLMASRVARGAEGADGVVLISRGLTVDSQRKFVGQNPDQADDLLAAWADDPESGEPERSGVPPQPYFVSAEERRHGLSAPIHVYPLIETALRAKYRKDFATHHQSVSSLMASFSEVAASGAERQYAWLPTERTAEEIATPSGGNRWVGYPYTKYMCANDNVDGAASWLLCSVRTAKRLGVERSRWVYLLSGAQCHEGSDDKWFVSGREDLTAQPAMRSSITNCLVRHRCPGVPFPRRARS